jgi:hypothetical protein
MRFAPKKTATNTNTHNQCSFRNISSLLGPAGPSALRSMGQSYLIEVKNQL